MQSLAERLARAEREIALALEDSYRPHTEAEHVGILIWEMDWRVEQESVLEEMRFELTLSTQGATSQAEASAHVVPPVTQ